ncbi:hypothetical protein OHA64_47470 [Streptomyces sp. NBC_00076]
MRPVITDYTPAHTANRRRSPRYAAATGTITNTTEAVPRDAQDAHGEAGVVDQDVQTAQPIDGFVYSCLWRGRICHIDHDGNRGTVGPGDRGRDGSGGVVVTVRHRHCHSVAGEVQGDGPVGAHRQKFSKEKSAGTFDGDEEL